MNSTKTKRAWTGGEWKQFGTTSMPRILDNKYTTNIVSPGLGIVGDGYGRTKEESVANALLFSEAGTIANLTGLSPKQLMEQRDELLEAILAMQELSNRIKEPSDEEFEAVDRRLSNAIEAIQTPSPNRF